jgi:hypothetical protein
MDNQRRLFPIIPVNGKVRADLPWGPNGSFQILKKLGKGWAESGSGIAWEKSFFDFLGFDFQKKIINCFTELFHKALLYRATAKNN